jgi:uncharacterized protein YndB with AHSA1/START domain
LLYIARQYCLLNFCNMSKKSNKKSSKNKVSKKKTTKKTSAKKPTPKAKSKKPAPKKKVKVTKAKKNKPVTKKKTVAKKIAAKKPIVKKVQKPAKAIAKPAVKTVIKVKPAPALKPVKAEVSKPVKAPKPARRNGPPAPRNLVPVVSKKSIVIDIKTGPEPKGRFELEYVVHSSAPILFEFLTSPSGLSEWFCDDVNIRNGVYSFKWEENEQQARVVKLMEEKQVRFQWVEKTDNSYFEFRIERDDLTNDISLIVVDFAETIEDRHSSTLLWNSQIDKLLHVLGSYF